MVAEAVALLVVGIVALWLGARFLVDGAASLAAAAGISPLVVGITVVAFGTSAPEIAVSAEAALAGRGDVAVGNVLGSNLFNIGVILGLVAIVAPFRVTETLLRRDALAMAGATAVGIGVLATGHVSRLEGGVLLALLAGYLAALVVAVRRGRDEDAGGQVEQFEQIEHLDGNTTVASESNPAVTDNAAPSGQAADTDRQRARLGIDVGSVLVGLAFVLVGGHLLVESAVDLALHVGISEWIVGVTIVAAGTSLPELVTALVAALRRDVAIAAGNVIGSNVFNLLGVLGIAAVVNPLVVDPAALLALAWLAALTAFATGVLATGRRLTRLEGGALLALGIGYWIVSVVV